MVKLKKELQIVTPVGEAPSTDKELHRRVNKVRKAGISEVFNEVSDWEKFAVARFRKREQTKKSGKLTIHCR